MRDADVIIIGGGIAGISLAARLAGRARVMLLEQEKLLAVHTTGRSAALFSETYGNAFVRKLSAESRSFFESPPQGFGESPLLSSRPSLFVARKASTPLLDKTLSDNRETMRELSQSEALRRMPVLRPGLFSGFAEEPGSMDIDVGGLFEGFRRMALAGGVEFRMEQPVVDLSRDRGCWQVRTQDSAISAAIVVNAAGAWSGRVGVLAGLGDRSLAPLRRTIIALDPPEGVDLAGWMFVNDVGDDFYFKPEAGLVLASPVDETLSEPCDAQPEEIDIATIAYRIEEATTIPVRRIRRRWAGLRTFTPDRTPVFEFDKTADGFFWLVGQGGYGIQTSPAISAHAATAILARL